MGNRWEETSRETTRFKCACGQGYFYIDKIVIEDDFLREREIQEDGCTCEFCSDRFILIGNKIKFKKVFNLNNEFKSRIEELKSNLKNELYDKYIYKILYNFRSKKSLYEFLYDNNLLSCSISTFYKDGQEFYISKDRWSLDKLEKVLYTLNILDKEDIEKINNLKSEIEKIEIFANKELKILNNKEKEELEKYRNELIK